MTADNHKSSDVPVLIVGAGPVGLGLAIDLGHRGVPCMVVEQGDGSFAFPRANAVSVRTMELCRRWGIADEVRAESIPPDYPHTALYLTSLAGHEIGRVERASHGGGKPSQFSPERPQRCNQMFFDPVLLRHARTLPQVELRYNTRFETFSQGPDGVTARLTDLATGKTDDLSAGYLIACCGGHSCVRDDLGIKLQGLPEEGTPVHVFFRSEALWDQHEKGKASLHYLMGPEGRWSTLINVNGDDLWSLAVEIPGRKGEIGDDEARGHVDRALGKPVDYEVRSISYWNRREMVADGYGEGRVFIAGDCAHLNGPEGGYGMNTGMGDAMDLGWKLWADYAGWGGPGLVASYEAERRPIALRNIAEATRNLRNHAFDYPEILLDTPAGAAERRECGERIERDGQRRHGHNGLMLGFRYASPLIHCANEGEPPVDDTANYVPSSYPGCRAPHLWLSDEKSIIDLFGGGFVLLRLGSGAPEVSGFLSAAQSRDLPLEVVDIADGDIREAYERDLVLIRPDGHVAWRDNFSPEDPEGLIDAVRGA